MRFLAFICLIFMLCGCTARQAPATTSAATTPAPTTPAATTPAPTTPAPTTAAPTTPEPTAPPDPARELLDKLTVEEKVGQLFLVYCEESIALRDIERYHLGGFILFANNTKNETPDSLRAKLQGYQAASKIPLLIAVDEEGGKVNRISCYKAYRAGKFPSSREAFAQGGMEGALKVEEEKAGLLSSLGINVNLGPVCDITRSSAAFMYSRSLGQDPETTGQFIAGTVGIAAGYNVGSCLKHFPGYGENTDTHVGIAVDKRSLESLESVDLVPFRYGIDAGCGAIMISHTYINAIDPDHPATLSPAVHSYLREEMGFAGVIVTDDLMMQAITDRYGIRDAAVLAVNAGNDLLCCCSTQYATQYKAVLAAVQDGRISPETLDAAVYRLLQWKMDLGLI